MVTPPHGAWMPVDTLTTRVQRSWSSSPTLGSSWRINWTFHVLLAIYVRYGGRAFAYAGPTSWNSLPDGLKNINLTLQTFKRHLKTFLFSTFYTLARLRFLTKTRYINPLLLLLLARLGAVCYWRPTSLCQTQLLLLSCVTACICHACTCLLYTSPSPRDRTRSRMPSSA